MSSSLSDGVIRYRLLHHPEPLDESAAALARTLDGCRWRLWREGLIGQDGIRYGGVGWGNVSGRLDGPAFLVTGTQTGGLEHTDERHYAVVEQCVVTGGGTGEVHSRGPVQPSSEAMSHAAVYAAAPEVRFVFHIHAPALWNAAEALGLPQTPRTAEYGTVAMAEAVAAVAGRGGSRVLVMGGHQDGVLAWGERAEELLEALLASHRASLLLGPDDGHRFRLG
jgi:hypothetical protein